MKRMGIWILLMSKRLLKRPSFVIILCLLPCLLISYRYLIREEDTSIRVGLYFEEGENAFTSQMKAALKNNDVFASFYVCPSENELYNDVAAGRAECGYIFDKEIQKRFVEKDWDAVITVVVSDNSRFADYINEIVYARLFYTLADELMTNFLSERAEFGEGREEIEQMFKDAYLQADSTESIFQIHYLDENKNEIVKEKALDTDYNYLTKPIRGTVALFVLLSGLAGLVFWFQDEQEGRFRAFTYYRRPYLNVGSLMLPVGIGGLVALVCMLLSGIGKNPLLELVVMILYCLLVTGFCNLLRLLVPSVNAICAMIPILSIASYLCCPVIMNLAVTVPAIGYIRPILVVNYYLEVFISSSNMWKLVLAAILLLPATVLWDFRKHAQA